MSKEIPIRRATINPDNGWVIAECPETKKPRFTHAEKGCKDCEHNRGATEDILNCNFPVDDESIHVRLERVRETLAKLGTPKEL